MKGTITIKLENGTVLEGFVELSSSAVEPAGVSPDEKAQISSPKDALDFSLPLRPFMNDYSDGLSGSKKFTLIVAHYAGGQLDVPVDRAAVVEAWNKMTGMLGGKFNTAHESRAKDSGYVYVAAPGKLALLKKWRQVVP